MSTRIGHRGVRALSITAALLLLTASAAVAVGHLSPSTTDVQPVLAFSDGSDTGGQSVLTRTGGMVVAVVEAEGLTPGNAMTMWWVVFNDPAACSDGACGEDDIFLEDGSLNEDGIVAAQIAIGNATGNLVKADGTAELGSRLKVGDTSGAHQVVIPAGFQGSSLLTASGNDAEVHLVLQDHGQARGGERLLEQITYLEAHCTPACSDVQFAVHVP